MVSAGLLTEVSDAVMRKWCTGMGKSAIITTKSAGIKHIETIGLKYAPVLEGDVIQLSAKPKTVQSYISRQMDDIAKYGEKQVERVGVTEAMLQKYTPHRRLSNKPCTLKNPKDYEYYIKKYEKEMGEEYLPTNWEKLTDAQKYDFIVKDRYSRVVSNKIMDSIQHESIEHCYSLSKDGEILGYYLGNMDSAKAINTEFCGVTIHNHPLGLTNLGFSNLEITISPQEFCQNISKSMMPHSAADIVGGFYRRGKTYVVDSNGNKFLFQAINKPCRWDRMDPMTVLEIFDPLYNKTFNAGSSNEIIMLNNKIKKLEKGTQEYNILAKQLKEYLYRYHESEYSEQQFLFPKEIVEDFNIGKLYKIS